MRAKLVLGHAAAVVAMAACVPSRLITPVAPPPDLPEPRRAVRMPSLPEWYWEPVQPDLRAGAAASAIDLPLAEPLVARVEGATRTWDELGVDGRDRVQRDGLVVLGGAEARFVRMGAFYMDVRQRRIPYLVTLDALTYALHLAFERALAEVDDTLLAPELDALLTGLEARLSAEQAGAGVEMRAAIHLARGVIAVARALAHGTERAAGPVAPPELASVVAEEVARITAHAGRSRSPLLGAPIDYARFAAPSAAGRPGSFRAMTWLASAPLLLSAQSEIKGAVVGVATSRLHTRAAMLLARVASPELDSALHASWSRIAHLLTFIWGPPDDLSPSELGQLASSLGITLEDPKRVADVVTVDRIRHRAARGRPPLVFDGAGAPGRPGIGMRLFGGNAPPDTVALASLTSPLPTSRAMTTEGAVRRLPALLDIAVWLGAPEARASLAEAGADAWTGYDAALTRATGVRPRNDATSRHASLYRSQLDVVMAWLVPREKTSRALASPAAQRMAIESALAAWTFARHAGQPLSRPRSSRVVRTAKELSVAGAALPAFIEPAPYVIARLVATARQTRRGLAALGNIPATSPAMTLLAEVEDLLRVAMRVAARQVEDTALSTEDVAALGSFPARLARLEEDAQDGGAAVPVVVPIMVDAAGERVLSSATGIIEPLVTVAREPGTGRLVLVMGAHVTHHELVEPRDRMSTDASHRARFLGGAGGAGGARSDNAPPRGAYTSSFRLVR